MAGIWCEPRETIVSLNIHPGVVWLRSPAIPAATASPASETALFDVVSEPVPPAKQSVVPFVAFSVGAGTLSILSALFVIRWMRAQALARKIKNETV